MVASLGGGAGLGVVGGLHRLGNERARLSPDVALSSLRAAIVIFAIAWLVVVTLRFGRLLRAQGQP
jgi:hypothetical protein